MQKETTARGLAILILVSCAISGLTFQPSHQKPLSDFDRRIEAAGPARTAPQIQADGLRELQRRLPGARAEFDPVSGSPRLLSVPGGFLTGPQGKGASVSDASLAAFGPGDPHRVAKAFLREHRALFGHGPEALDQARITRNYITPHNGLRTVVWEQEVDGIPVFKAAFIAHITSKGELVSLSDQFIADAPPAAARGTPNRVALLAAPGVSAAQALSIAARGVGEETAADKVLALGAAPAGAEQRRKFTAPGLAGEAEVKFIWAPTGRDTLRLCWDVLLTSRQRGEMFRVLVDAGTGEALFRQCLTRHISDATYRVFPSDNPSPLSPGHSTPLTNQPPIVPRTLITLPAWNTNASPNGWIDDGVNETRGNNVDAHTDRNADNIADLPRPQGSPFRVFDFPMDLTVQDPTNYSAAAVAQLFYVCNWMHDRLYELGFTEAAGNFQINNFGRGGSGNDPVQADAQDGGGLNNANMSTPPDGFSPRMQMYIFSGTTPRRDGDFDVEIVLHEYTHGLSWRLVGGGQGLGTTQSDGMGEGWSDWYGLALLSHPGDALNGCYAAGAYASHRLGGTNDNQNYYFGIRRYPYSTDLTKNPLTFNDIDPAQADHCASGAPYHTALYGPCSALNSDEVHNSGEVWCVALWEARANLIARHGWATGNELILRLVTDGMKLTPPEPNFLQARDAILTADQVNNGGANLPELWAAFAKRGMGYSATSPDSTTTAGLVEAFDVPDVLRIAPATGFTSRGPVGGPFDINSAALTLTNIGTNAFAWSLVSTSAWLNVTPADGALAAGASAVVTASLTAAASALPVGIYNTTVWFSNHLTGARQSRGFTLRAGQIDSFTELFVGDNDLDFQSFTFTPDGSANFYSACREVVTAFPTDPAGGTTISLSDDSFYQATLAGTNTVAIHHRRTNVFFIGSNGYLTMDLGDTSYIESPASHFNRPRVSALFDDLNPGDGGNISWRQTADRVAVTFAGVREYSSSASVSFQIELFFDGRVRVTYLAVGITDGLAGVSAGLGLPAGFEESDFSSFPGCLPPDDLQVTPSAGLIALGHEGGPFTPSNQVYTLRNNGSNALNWSLTATQGWLSASSVSGTLAPGVTANVIVSLNAQAALLAPGVYAGAISFSNLISGFAQTRSTVLTVRAIPGEIAVLDSITPADDLLVPFGNLIAGLSRTEQITITNLDPVHGLIVSNISFGAYLEDFEDGLAQDWVEASDAHWSVVSGEYRAQAGTTDAGMQSLYFGERWQDASAQVTLRRAGDINSAARVLLRATDDFNGPAGTGSAYAFAINADGWYYVGKHVSGTFSFLQEWTSTPELNPGTGSNIVLATVEGTSIRLHLNGQLVWSGTDTSIAAPGRVGLLAYSGITSEAVHFFDDVIVSDPLPEGNVVDAAQLNDNAHPHAGGSPDLAPPATMANQGRPRAANGGSYTILALTNGPFRLANVPALPHTVPPGGSVTFDVTYQPAAVGSNYTRVVIDSNDDDESRVQVQLIGQGIPDHLWISPASGFVSTGHPGGPFTPPSAAYLLSNAGPISITWSVTHTQAWVNALPAGGTLAPGQTVTLTADLTAAAATLPEGVHRDALVFSNHTTTRTQTRDVVLTIFTSPIVVVQPGSFSVTNALGRSTNVILTVSNAASADANLTFSISAQETGRSVQSLIAAAAAAVRPPPEGRDFTRVAPGKEFASGRLLVRFDPALPAGQRATLLGGALGGAQVVREFKLVPGLALVTLPPGQAVAAALPAFNGTPGVLYAEPDYRVKVSATTPNDPLFSELWGLHNTGQTGGTPDADINAPEAWDFQTGSREVIVAVIDTGVDYTHPDLAGNIWTNAGEVPGNDIDDDDNGFIDDVHGYDFVNGDGDPMDDHYHGTHVAGTIGAEGNNGIGVAGVCWKARIMALKFLDFGGGGSSADAISAIEYATLMGARVMNNSWGGGPYEQSLKDVIDAAGAAGVAFVAAAGNDYGNDNDLNPAYPASYDSAGIISVLSTDHDDLLSDFSNLGLLSVDLGAPGTDVLSCEPGGGYQLLSGTSMATPHVAGACALLLSANPLLSVADLKQALMSTVDSNLPGLCVAGGRLNLNRALASVGAAWISYSPAGATNLPPGGSVQVTVGFHAGELSPGDYTGRVVIACNDLVSPSVNVPVAMRVLEDALNVTPGGPFVSVGAQGGLFVPAEMNYTLSNRSVGPVNWAVSQTQNWVSMSIPAGTLPGGASLVVTGYFNAAASLLATGLYTDTLVFSNKNSGGIHPRPVSLSVVPAELSMGDASVTEGNAGSTSAVFTVTLWPPNARTVVVAYATASSSAQAGSDYLSTNGLLTFSPGETNRFISVTILGDTNIEPNETFLVNLSNATNALFARAQGQGTIFSDDMGPFFDDFDPEIDFLQWSAFGGMVMATNFGGFVSGPNALWFGGDEDRLAASHSLNTTPGGVVEFWLRLSGGIGYPWEQADLPDEGVVIEYSTNDGGTWTEFGRYDTAIYTAWTRVTVDIPAAAQTGNTRFRWRQLSHTGGDYDHWALDDAGVVLGPRPPSILVHPAGVTAVTGGFATFSVTASGNVPLSYFWRRDGMLLAGATNASYTLTNCQTSDSGAQFSCLVSNASGTAQSSAATLVVISLPVSAEFRIVALLTNNSRVVDHAALTGDDRGGIAASSSRLFYSGDFATAGFSLADLSGGTSLGGVFDAMTGDLRSGAIYSLAGVSGPLTSTGGTATRLLEHDGVTGLLNGSSINLSAPISLPGSTGNVGIFAGYGRIVVHSGTRVYNITLPSGLVTDLGAMTVPLHMPSENWAYWGVAENFGGVVYLACVRDSQTIVRSAVPSGVTSTLAGFSNLSDMACFTVSLTHSRWYFHHEYGGQFGGTSETVGYADGQFSVVGLAPVLQIISHPAGQVTLSFPSLAGVNYVLEYKVALDDAHWTALAAYPGDGTVKSFIDTPSGAAPQRFYQLRLP